MGHPVHLLAKFNTNKNAKMALVSSRLTRNEIVSLFNAFGRISTSIQQLENFRKMTASSSAADKGCTLPLNLSNIILSMACGI